MEPRDWKDIENNPTYRDIQRMYRRIDDVIARRARLGMFCSDPGVGKTYACAAFIRRSGIRLKIPQHNPANPSALARSMWEAKLAQDPLYLIDDADRLARSEAMIGICKTAWAGQTGTVVPFETIIILKNEHAKNNKYNPSIPPPRFSWDLGVLWNSNKDFASPEGRKVNNACEDFNALIDRGLDPLWINSEPRNVCLYTVWMIVRGNLFREMGLSVDEQVDVLDYFLKRAHEMPRPNLRTAVRLAAARRMPNFQTRWDDIVRVNQMTSESRPLTKDEFRVRPDLKSEISLRQTRLPRKVIIVPPSEPAHPPAHPEPEPIDVTPIQPKVPESGAGAVPTKPAGPVEPGLSRKLGRLTSNQMKILALLESKPKPASRADLLNEIGGQPSAIQKGLNGLISRGIVAECDDDKYEVVATTTVGRNGSYDIVREVSEKASSPL